MPANSQPGTRKSTQITKARGRNNSSLGKTKKFVSAVADRNDAQREGSDQGAKIYAERKLGTVKEQLQKVSYAVGDGFKKFGMRLQQKGYDRAGRALERVGGNLTSSVV